MTEGAGLVLAALVVGVLLWLIAASWRAHRFYNVRIRRETLGEDTSLWGLRAAYHVVHVLRRKESDPQTLQQKVAALQTDLEAEGGRVTYLGRVVKGLLVKSAQLPGSDQFDVLVVSRWSTPRAFVAWRATQMPAMGWASETAQGMWRNPLLNLLLAQGMTLLRTISWLRSRRIDLATEADEVASGGSAPSGEQYGPQALRSWAAKLEAGAEGDEGVILYNFLKNGTREQRRKNAKYSLAMMKMLAQNGGGLMHAGRAQRPSEETDGQFDVVAAVYYPGVAFMAKLLRSQWMSRNVEGKALGDTLVVATVPYQRGKLAAAPLQ